MQVKIVNKSRYDAPSYATEYSAGMDLKANIEQPVILGSLDRAMIPTGLFIELPEGYEAQIRPRSGLAAKHGITVTNAPGTIDADYRGEICVLLVNLGLFPEEPQFPVVEVRPELPVNEKLIAGKRRLWSSDAHHLGDILEAVSELETNRFSLGGLFDTVLGF